LDSVITQLQEKLKELSPMDKITQSRRIGDQCKAAGKKYRISKNRVFRLRQELKEAEAEFDAAKEKHLQLKQEWHAMDITLSDGSIADPDENAEGERNSADERDDMETETSQAEPPTTPTSMAAKKYKLSPGDPQTSQESISPVTLANSFGALGSPRSGRKSKS